MEPDYVIGGQGFGGVAATLMANNFDPNCLRPFVGNDGRNYVPRFSGKFNAEGQPIYNAVVTNTPATLRKDDWKILDEAIIRVARQRLRVFGDLRASGNVFTIPNGMGKTVLESENMGDINDAQMTMDGIGKTQNDRPEFDLVNLPLPIIHKDFSFSARQIASSRSGGSPLDTTMAELAARKCAEQIEKLTLGTLSAYTFGGATIYGYTNYPSRMTATLTLPTAAGWTGATLVEEVLAMRQQSIDAYHYGPWTMYNSPAWDVYLDNDYSAAKGDQTLRQRLAKIEGVSPTKTADYLTGYQLLLVQNTSDVARAVIGMDFTTLQWESHGGLQLNFKVMGILVPQLRADQNGRTGIVHGTAA